MENCRLSCEKPFDQGWYPDFISSTASIVFQTCYVNSLLFSLSLCLSLDHFTFCLKCKSQCEEKLSNLDGNVLPDFLPLIFNYLQYSYFKGTGSTPNALRIENPLTCLPTITYFFFPMYYLRQYIQKLVMWQKLLNVQPPSSILYQRTKPWSTIRITSWKN